MSITEQYFGSLLVQARTAASRGRFDDARRYYNQAMGVFPRRSDVLLEIGVMEAQAGDLAAARNHLERALKQLPRDPNVHFNLGEVANAERRHEQAEGYFRRVLELDSGYSEAFFGLGRSLMMMKRHDDAVTWLRKAAASAPRDADIFNLLGLALNECRRYPEAIEAFRTCLQLAPARVVTQLSLAIALDGAGHPDSAHEIIRNFEGKAAIPPPLWSRLATICYGVKDFTRARQFAERAIESGHGVGRASDLKAKLIMDGGDFNAAEALLRDNLAKGGPSSSAWLNLAAMGRLEAEAEPAIRQRAQDEQLSNEERSVAYFALYHLLKRGEATDDAFAALDLANRLSRGMQPIDVSGDLMLSHRITSVFDRAFVEPRQNQGFQSEGCIFVLGMPRSGTTLVEQVLAAHPDVHAGDERDDILKLRRSIPGYPEGVAELPPTWAAQSGEAIFKAMFADAGGRRFATDKLPANTLNIGLIHWILPKARLVYCRRTPQDNALSLYEQNFGRNIAFAADLAACGAMYRDHLRLMDHWQRDCGIPVHTVDYEALVDDPELHIRALLSFVGLPWNNLCLAPEKVDRRIATASVWQVRQPIARGSIGKWQRFERHLRPFSDALNGGADKS